MILLDTHAWIWTVDDPARVPAKTLRLIESQDLVLVSSISCWEVSMLVAKGRLTLTLPVREWIDQTLRAPDFEIIPLSMTAARVAGGEELDWPHSDPSYRMIVATAIELNVPLVTADAKITAIPGIVTVW